MTEGTDNLGEKAAAGESQTMPDRAQEHRVDVPQNETAAPAETAQAQDADPTPAPNTEVNQTSTDDGLIAETPVEPTDGSSAEGNTDNS